MENLIEFGTYNVPSIESSLTATFVAPGRLPANEIAKFMFYQDDDIDELSDFNQSLKQALEFNPKA